MSNYRRYHLPHHPVFVTIVTNNRRKIFASAERVELLLVAMRRVKVQYPFRHYAHVILPDHLHWMFECDEACNFSKIVGAVKRDVTWRLKETFTESNGGKELPPYDTMHGEPAGRHSHSSGCIHGEQVGRQSFPDIRDGEFFPLWQKRFYDHLIRDETDFARHLDYVHYNPVKHGFVDRAADFAHSSFAGWMDRGVYSINWGVAEPERIKNMDLE
ncbi:MAG: hypothetical protein BM485_16965 [Desulfobulbaceae bacterium DB1]|nr:MAG: hypothetical protein BM485_16965 [Desulfobulbaceae bacterium DB1]